MTTTKQRYVKVSFTSTLDKNNVNDQSGYYYKDTLKTPLKPFDSVIVPTRYGLALAVIESTSDNEPTSKYHSCKFLEVAEKIESVTLDNINKQKRSAAIEKEIEQKLKDMDKLERFKKYAEDSPEIAALVKELEGLK